MALTTPIYNLNAAGKPVAPVMQNVSYITNGISTDITQTQFPLQLGVPVKNLYNFQVIPAESGTLQSNTCVSQITTLNGAGSFTLPLNTTNTVSVVNPLPLVSTISQVVSANGQYPAILLDCERCIALYFGSVTTVAVTCTVQALDYRGVPMTIQQNVPIGTSSIAITNPVSVVLSVVLSGNPVSVTPTVAVGNAGVIGYPYYIRDVTQIVQCIWNGVAQEQGDAFAGLIAGYNWRATPPSSATSMINPTRGYFITTSDGQPLPNGNIKLCTTYNIQGSDSELNANVQNLNESAIGCLGVSKTTSGDYALPYIVEGDLIGVQWNSNSKAGQRPFITTYTTLKAS